MKQEYLRHQINTVFPYLEQSRTILDFGCGDLSLSKALISKNGKWRITGIDVVGEKQEVKKTGIKYKLYDGKTIPFPDRSFDALIAYHVFHHCQDPEASFRECVRVTKKRLILVEPVLRSLLEKPGFSLMDILTNLHRKEAIPMPGKIHYQKWWYALFDQLDLKVIRQSNAGFLPSWLPIGKTVLWVLEKA